MEVTRAISKYSSTDLSNFARIGLFCTLGTLPLQLVMNTAQGADVVCLETFTVEKLDEKVQGYFLEIRGFDPAWTLIYDRLLVESAKAASFTDLAKIMSVALQNHATRNELIDIVKKFGTDETKPQMSGFRDPKGAAFRLLDHTTENGLGFTDSQDYSREAEYRIEHVSELLTESALFERVNQHIDGPAVPRTSYNLASSDQMRRLIDTAGLFNVVVSVAHSEFTAQARAEILRKVLPIELLEVTADGDSEGGSQQRTPTSIDSFYLPIIYTISEVYSRQEESRSDPDNVAPMIAEQLWAALPEAYRTPRSFRDFDNLRFVARQMQVLDPQLLGPEFAQLAQDKIDLSSMSRGLSTLGLNSRVKSILVSKKTLGFQGNEELKALEDLSATLVQFSKTRDDLIDRLVQVMSIDWTRMGLGEGPLPMKAPQVFADLPKAEAQVAWGKVVTLVKEARAKLSDSAPGPARDRQTRELLEARIPRDMKF